MAPSHSGLRRKLITYFRLVMPKAKPKSKDRALKGWGQIVEFLGPDRVCGATLAEVRDASQARGPLGLRLTRGADRVA
jgi:hypothetical protein